jgi:diguanylate cyclase (GGDEF)-like protein
VLRILLADNVALYQKILGRALADTNAQFFSVSTFAEAQNAIETAQFDVICCAMYLEDATAVNLVKYIRSKEQYKHIPFLILTVDMNINMRQTALQAGATSIFSKSTELDDLIIYLRRFAKQFSLLSGRVLVLEDSQSQREMVVSILQDAGLDVDAYPTVEEGKNAFEENDYDIVITDIILAGKQSGLDMVNVVRRRMDNKGDTPIMAMTYNDDVARRIELFRIGVNDYLAKPFSPDEILVRVRHLLQGFAGARAQQSMLDNMLNFSVDPVCVVDKQGVILHTNSLFDKLINIDGNKALSKRFLDYIPIASHRMQFKHCLKHNSESMLALDVTIEGKKGEHPYQLLLQSYKDAETNSLMYMILFRDRGAEADLSSKLDYLSEFDSLTNLKNRSAFNRDIEVMATEYPELGIVIINVHQFKFLNEHYSHQVADNILQLIADRLEERFGTFAKVYRIVADEFALISFHQNDIQSLVDYCESVLGVLSRPYFVNGELIKIRPNIGAVAYPAFAETVNRAINLANGALGMAKKLPKAVPVIINKELANQLQDKNQIRFYLQRALERREFKLFYQPQVDAQTRICCGAEALLRWHNEELGDVSPEDFIPIAEGMGILTDIGDWVLREAINQLKVWRELRPDLKMAINVSPSQLQHTNFLENISSSLASLGEDPKIEIEITEQVFLVDPNKAIQQTKTLQSLGVDVSIDDFGTGFSSLAYLKQLAFNTIKIDQYFVFDLPGDRDSAAVVLSILDLAKHFSAFVVAEGVETEAQAQFLTEHGCNVLQGYLFGKPMSAANFDKYLVATVDNQQKKVNAK